MYRYITTNERLFFCQPLDTAAVQAYVYIYILCIYITTNEGLFFFSAVRYSGGSSVGAREFESRRARE